MGCEERSKADEGYRIRLLEECQTNPRDTTTQRLSAPSLFPQRRRTILIPCVLHAPLEVAVYSAYNTERANPPSRATIINIHVALLFHACAVTVEIQALIVHHVFGEHKRLGN